MAFTFYPTDLRVFTDVGTEAPAPGFALDDETGRICFKRPGFTESGGWVIVPSGGTCPSFNLDGRAAGAFAGLYNDAPYWNVTLNGMLGYVFSSIAFGWIWFSQLREPHAYLGPDGATWVGDGWYAFDRAPNDISVASVPSVPAGTFLNEIAAEDRATATGPAATPAWPRWERRSGTTGPVAPLGYYDPVGGATGVGLGNSLLKHSYLPENHTDFILAMVGEEMGLAATLPCLLVFFAMGLAGFRGALSVADPRLRLAALGLTLHLSLSAAVNVGVVTGAFPTKGLALPFLSYGGSSAIGSALAAGLLLAIAFRPGRERPRREPDRKLVRCTDLWNG